MLRCDNCNKGSLHGNNVSHSKRRTLKKSLPNLHTVTLKFGANRKRMKLCSSCLKIQRKLSIQSQKTKKEVSPVTAK